MKELKSIAIIALSLILSQSVFCQDPTTNIKTGITASIQGNQVDALIPIRFGRFSIAPSFGIVWTQDAGTDIRIGIVPRVYLGDGKAIPYLGAKCGVLFYTPSGGAAIADYVVGLSGGGEYFVDSHFSLGVEVQANLTLSNDKSSRFGNPGKTNMNTATAAYLTFYF